MSTIPGEFHVADLASIELGEPRPKPTRVTEDQVEASRILWTSPDERVQIGVWESSPGTFTATRDGYSEVAHIISGRFTLVPDVGARTDHGPGDLVVTNEGWSGSWEIHETVRKLFIIDRSESAS